jgi:protein tyrosine phosphatase (PTP) superfamily phosphohydrolase (DUF442 family)
MLIAPALPCFASPIADPSSAGGRPPNWAVKQDRPGLSNFYQLTTNFYRGAQPSREGMAQLKAMGIKMVLNLRSWHSDNDELLGIGLKQGRLHMEPWHVSDEDVVRFLKLVTNTNNLPVFVHCQRGADRTGTVCAIYRIIVCGWSREEAIRELKQGGFGFNPAWQNLVDYIRTVDTEKIKRMAGLVAQNTPHASRFRLSLLRPFPGPFQRFCQQSLFDRAGRDPNIAHLPVGQLGFDTLKIRQEPPFGNGGDMGADAALFLGFAAAPDNAAFARAFAGQFTNSRHKILF